jgi:hypothetical protein
MAKFEMTCLTSHCLHMDDLGYALWAILVDPQLMACPVLLLHLRLVLHKVVVVHVSSRLAFAPRNKSVTQ